MEWNISARYLNEIKIEGWHLNEMENHGAQVQEQTTDQTRFEKFTISGKSDKIKEYQANDRHALASKSHT